MLEQMLFAGFGGQGVLVMGRLLAEAAMDQNLNATWLPAYGPEMRGGTANCITVVSDDEIGSPIAAQYDAVVAMNQPSLEKFQSKVKPGGILLINSSMIPIRSNRTDVQNHYLPANDIAVAQSGTQRSANVVTIGALHALRPFLKTESLTTALQKVFGAKGKEVVDLNIRSLHAGTEAITKMYNSLA